MIEEIKKVLKGLEGKVVAFGFKSEKFNSILNSNPKIITFDVFNEINKKTYKKGKKQKTIDVSKIGKKYKKKKINTILINVDAMDQYMIYLIKETIYIGKENLYLFGTKENVDKYLNKYKRYNIKFEEKNYSNNAIIKIDISNSKNNKIKDKYYILKDKFLDFFELISKILTS